MTSTWDRVLAFMLEQALKQLPPGTRITVEDYDLQKWFNRSDAECQVRLAKQQEPGYLGTTYAAWLVNDKRTTAKRKFDLEQ